MSNCKIQAPATHSIHMLAFRQESSALSLVQLTLQISGEHEMDDLDTLLISSAGS
jgi:hypothetical protein